MKERGIPDPLNPRATDLRALQMKPYKGTITPEALEALQKRGVDVGNIDPKLLGAMGLTSAAAIEHWALRTQRLASRSVWRRTST